MSNGNYIKLNRSMLKWEWYDDVNVARVFTHLLLTVNYKPKKWHGIEIGRGQRVMSYRTLAEETNLSVQEVRTAIKKLIATGELTQSPTSNYTIVTVENYSKFQDADVESNTQPNTQPNTRATHEQHTINNNIRKKERKERKEDKNNNPPISPHAVEIVSHLNSRLGTSYKPTTKKTQSLIRARLEEGFTVDDFKAVIDKKCVEWANDDKMAQYLRPETLFGTKFESYLNSPVKKPSTGNKFLDYLQEI